MNISEQAALAIRVAKNWLVWGHYASLRFCAKRNVDLRLVQLAVKLDGENRRMA